MMWSVLVASPNPMENVFLRIIEDIGARIFSRARPIEDEQRELQAHLDKARRLGWRRYEAKTLNAMAILHRKHPEKVLKLLTEASEVAAQTDDWMLQSNLRNNLATCYMSQYEYKRARQQYEQALDIVAEQEVMPIAYLFLQSNLALLAIWDARYDEAQQRLDDAQGLASEISFTGQERFSYGRGIYLMRTTLLRLQIVQRDEAAARASLGFSRELAEQLQIETSTIEIYSAFLALVFDGDDQALRDWIAQPSDDTHQFSYDLLPEIIYLNGLGYRDLALHWAREALAHEQDDERLRTHLYKFIQTHSPAPPDSTT